MKKELFGMSRASTTASDMAAFVNAAKTIYGDTVSSITRDQIKTIVAKTPGLKHPWWLEKSDEYRIGRGVYSLTKVAAAGMSAATATSSSLSRSLPKMAKMPKIRKTPTFIPNTPAPRPTVETSSVAVPTLSASENNEAAEQFEHASLVPVAARGYVPFGHFNTMKSIIASRIFYPAFVTGLSGNGKTMMIEQVCAQLGREFVRVNVTAETDEDDLIGGFRLQDGKTVWQNGPVIVAMERGAILLLDEVDLGTNKLMCLQPVLEGKPIYLKKINKVVRPAPGFNILATANTKGQGSFDGKFVGTNVLNEAFLERFPITIEQEYPSSKTEIKILVGSLDAALENAGVTLPVFQYGKAEEFVTKLVGWAEGIRKLYAEGGITEIISTRRLVHIINAFVIFGLNRRMAIELCLSRFDTDTKIQFVDLYSKIDAELDGIAEGSEEPLQTSSPQPSTSEEKSESTEQTWDPSVHTPSNPAPRFGSAPVAGSAQKKEEIDIAEELKSLISSRITQDSPF